MLFRADVHEMNKTSIDAARRVKIAWFVLAAHHVLKSTYASLWLLVRSRMDGDLRMKFERRFVRQLFDKAGAIEILVQRIKDAMRSFANCRLESTQMRNVKNVEVWRRSKKILDDAKTSLGPALTSLVRALNDVRRAFVRDQSTSSLPSRRRDRLSASMIGVPSHRMVVANDAEGLRRFLATWTRGGNVFFRQTRRVRNMRDSYFRREKLNGIAGFRGTVSGGWHPDLSRYNLVKLRPWNNHLKDRHRKDKTEVSTTHGMTRREYRKAKNKLRRAKKKGGGHRRGKAMAL